jgi:hypothetical protein
MANTMSVKILVSSLIADIERTLAKIDTDIANYPAVFEAYRLEVFEYNKNLLSIAVKSLGKENNIGTSYDSPIRIEINQYTECVNVEFNPGKLNFPARPVAPVKPNTHRQFGKEYIKPSEILERNLKVLRMSKQEEVSASFYSSVIELI